MACIGLTPFDQTINFMGTAMEPVTWVVAAGVIAGGAYLVAAPSVPYLWTRPGSIFWVLGLGLALRLVMMAPEPIFENDFFRYLWDGAVIVSGHSPYEWSPDQVLSGAAPDELRQLAKDSSGAFEQINYPHLTTIYPPVAEAVFAAASWIEPWSLMAWRLLILAFEGATVALLYCLLKQLGRSPLWIVIYWWNPVVIVELSNAAHMDAILLPFLIGSVLLALKTRASLTSAACLAIATAIKLWPVLLLPVLIRPVITRPRATLMVCAVFAIATAALLWPFITQAFHADAGLRNYSVSWERNAALFHVLSGGIQAVLDNLGWDNLDAGRLLRTGVGIVMIIITLGINRRTPADHETIIRRILIIIAALLLLGPTLYPWYYTWMVPFLAVVPSRALLAFSIVLPLYRLQFHPWFLDHARVFEDVVVWAEQGPVIVLLFMEWRARRRRLGMFARVPAS